MRKSRQTGSDLAVGLLLGLAVAASLPAQQVDVEAFTVPRPIEATMPSYPVREATRGDEGLVRVSFMVNTDGEVFDPIVAETIGSEGFRDAALAALEATRFTPALLDGEAIVGSATILYRFEMATQTQGASDVFSGLYRNLQRALRDADKDAIKAALADLEALGASNRYENAFLDLARYRDAVLHGTELEQMHALRGALSGSESPEDPVYLDATVVRELRRLLLPLQLRQNYFPNALDSYALMEAEGDAEGVAFFAETIARVRALALDATEYSIPLTLDASGAVSTRLYKRNIAFVGGTGHIVEVKLHCDQRYVAFEVERDVNYAVPSEWGACAMHLVGDPGAGFSLLQH